MGQRSRSRRNSQRSYQRSHQRNSQRSSELPLEMWHLIFKALVQQYARQPQKPGRCLLRYACVNREWQAFFEKEHFQRLMVSPERMNQQLGKLVPRQRRLVRHVWFQIELSTYACDCCPNVYGVHQKICLERQSAQDFVIVKEALQGILSILQTWSRGIDNDGLTLEIGLHSTSDFQRRSQDYGIDASLTDALEHSASGYKVPINDPEHKGSSGSRTAAPSLHSYALLHNIVFASDESFPRSPRRASRNESFPRSDVVHCLLVRRQTRRRLSAGLWHNMIKALPNLEYLHQELWRVQLTAHDMDQSRTVFSRVLSTLYRCRDLKKLVAFGDFNLDLGRVGPFATQPSTAPCKVSISSLAMRTRKLEHLCLSYVVNALSFLIFAEGQPRVDWPKLETLALTSPSLNIDNEADIKKLLEAAAKLACRMPRLRIMELWNAGKSHAFAFTCHITPFAVDISNRATWTYKIPDSIEKLWEDFAQKRNEGHKVCVHRGQLIDASEWKSHGDAIHALKLTADVIHPVSLIQIRREGKKTLL